MSMGKKKKWFYFFGTLLIPGLMIPFISKNNSREIKDIIINIRQEDNNFFTDKFEILSLMTQEYSDHITESKPVDLNPKVLEERVEKNPFISDAQIFRDLKGNLEVNVTQIKPIARIFDAAGVDRYIDEKGNIVPVNARYTARVVLMEMNKSFGWEKNMHETRYGGDVFKLLKYIDAHSFWRAQIAHIILETNGEVTFLPQVTKQQVIFGYPDNLEKKFKKLMVFYKQILPFKNWNSYGQVSLKYENQIVCK